MEPEHVKRTCEGKHVFSKMKFKFATALALSKCPKIIKLLHICAFTSELPFDISIMGGGITESTCSIHHSLDYEIMLCRTACLML